MSDAVHCGSVALDASDPNLVLDPNLRSEPCLDMVVDPSTPNLNLSPIDPSLRYFDPILSISCSQTVDAVVTTNSAPSLYRTASLTTNLGYRARRLVATLNDVGAYQITVSSPDFTPFISVVRSSSYHWQAAGDTLSFALTVDSIGPVVIEVTTLSRNQIGRFSVSLRCPSSDPTFTVYGTILPGTLGYLYSTIPVPKGVDWDPTSNLGVQVGSVFLSDMLAPVPPYSWSVVGFPQDLVLLTDDGFGNCPISSSLLREKGEFPFTVTAMKAGSLVGSQSWSMFVGEPLHFSPYEWLPNLWINGGRTNSILFWYQGDDPALPNYLNGQPGYGSTYFLTSAAYCYDATGQLKPSVFGLVVLTTTLFLMASGTEDGTKELKLYRYDAPTGGKVLILPCSWIKYTPGVIGQYNLVIDVGSTIPAEAGLPTVINVF